MNVPFLESDVTLVQIGKIADVLSDKCINTQMVENGWGEPLTVVARDMLDLYNVLGSVGIRCLN